jgi:S-adenosyl-L-methionine hydrolase (adenosine-forming)
MTKLITLTTDFGHSDGYVAAVKGTLLSLAPGAQLVDISHEIAPQDLLGAAFVLANAIPYFPDGAVHLVVVDPGVGSERRMLAARTARAIYVAPDNGVLTLIWRQEPPLQIVSLTERRYWRSGPISHTFHGRDVMGPVAAHLANGVELEVLGDALSDPVELDLPEPAEMPDGELRGEIIYVDRFGNLISNIPADDLAGSPTAHIENRRLPVGQHYAEVSAGEPLALIGSHGYLEIAVREGNASERLRLDRGAPVIVSGSPQ